MHTQNKSCRYEKLVIHTPHAGTILPIRSELRNSILTSDEFCTVYRQLTDHFTNHLFSAPSPVIQQVSFPYSRLFCDMERLIDDPLEHKGLGICYDLPKYVRGIPHEVGYLWCMTKQQAMMLYHAHHLALYQATLNGGLLLDCHSFSEQDNILSANAHEYSDIDICIGFNEDWSKPDDASIDFISHYFSECGYNVEFNSPFSNAMVAAPASKSLMIEVNKHCYMNEDTLALTSGYNKLHHELQCLYRLLL